MERLRQWLVVILAAGCLGMGYALYRDGRELALLRAQAAAQVQDGREIANLRRKLRSAAAADAARQKKAADERKAQAALQAAGQSGANAMNVIRMSDIIKDHPEFAALREKEIRRNIVRQYGDANDMAEANQRNAIEQPYFQAAQAKGGMTFIMQ